MLRYLLIICLIVFSKSGIAQENNVWGTCDILIYNTNHVIMAQQKTQTVVLMERDDWNIIKLWKFNEPVTGLAVYENKLFVSSTYAKGLVTAINLDSGEKFATLAVGMGATSPIVNREGNRLYICNQYQNCITEIDVESMAVLRTAKMDREPKSLVLSGDEKELYVTNFLPNQSADEELVRANVSVVDVKSFQTIQQIPLTNGSNALRDICLSPDSNYVFVSHNLGRFQVPTSQLQQGWMNTSGVSVIRTVDKEFMGTFLVDQPESGAAGVWGMTCDDKSLVISQSGTHDISVIDYKELIQRLNAAKDKEELSYDLRFLLGIRERLPILGNGPRNFVMDENEILIPTFFSDTLSIVNRTDLSVKAISYNQDFTESIVQKGEKYFNDATYCFQGWQSCNGCHPGDARTDAMNWDLLNDGIGNSKNCKSLLYSHVTAPAMISGIRPDAETAVRAGFVHIQFAQVAPERTQAVDEYLKSLEALPSPYLVNGELSDKAKKGREVFKKAQCNYCHSGPYFTDRKMYRIGKVEFEKGWDTPTLKEVWRTAPYLHDGSAVTIEELLKEDKHGLEHIKLKRKELDALVEYVNSL